MYVRILGKTLVSPTLGIISVLNAGPRFIDYWTRGFLAFSAVIIPLLYFFPNLSHLVRRHPSIMWDCLWFWPSSRIIEIGVAFYCDALDRLTGKASRTMIEAVERVQLLARSYLEVALNFSIIYFFLPRGMFNKNFTSIIEALYFSSMTITTTGYGDITPTASWSQLLCISEVAVGFLLIVFAFGSYMASTSKPSGSGSELAGQT